MEEAPPRDGTFQLVPSTTAGAWDFKVAINYGTPKPGSAIPAGTLYSAVTAEQMPTRPHVDSWGTYVAAQSEPAGTRVMWQHFTASLPTTPNISERIDSRWGKVYDHSYLDLITNTKPDRADLFATSDTAASYTLNGVEWVSSTGQTMVTTNQRVVLDVQESDMGQGLCRVVVTTLATPTVATEDDVLDEDSGTMLTIANTWAVTATKPTASALDAFNYYTEVKRVEHNIYLSTTRKASGLPTSRATALTWESLGKIYWPAVLQSYQFTVVMNAGFDTFRKTLDYVMRDPFAGDVRVVRRRWFQSTPITIDEPVNLLPSGIHIDDMGISIPESLHGTFTAEKFQIKVDPSTVQISYGYINPVDISVTIWNFAPTQQVDWPETVVRTEVTFTRGGYLCEESTYYRPSHYNTALLTITTREATAADIALGV